MLITPLFTTAELDSQIAAFKAALMAISMGQAYRLTTGGSERQVTKADLPEIRKTLEWLQGERVKLSIGGGPQIFTGRPRR
jgi:hypothetical protein